MKILALMFAMLVGGVAQAQIAPIQEFCSIGGVKVVTQGTSSTTTVMGSYPKCTVTVYLTGTTTKATIFSDNVRTPLGNPFTASTTGAFLLYAATMTGYDVVVSGGTPLALPAPFTYVDVFAGGSSGGGGTGSVTSVTIDDLPPFFTTAVAFPTTQPHASFTPTPAGQNTFLAGPATGGAGAYTFRAIQSADLPLGSSTTFGALKCGSGTTCAAGTITVAGAVGPISAKAVATDGSGAFIAATDVGLLDTAQTWTAVNTFTATNPILITSFGQILMTLGSNQLRFGSPGSNQPDIQWLWNSGGVQVNSITDPGGVSTTLATFALGAISFTPASINFSALANVQVLATGASGHLQAAVNVAFTNVDNSFVNGQTVSASAPYFKLISSSQSKTWQIDDRCTLSGTTFGIHDVTDSVDALCMSNTFAVFSKALSAASLQANTSIVNGGGLQIATGNVCTTTNVPLNTCISTMSLPTTEPNTTYSVSGCVAADATVAVATGSIGGRSTTGFSLTVIGLTSTANTTGTLTCLVTH